MSLDNVKAAKLQERNRLYHGTSSENIQQIEKEGLLAYGVVGGRAVYPWGEGHGNIIPEPQIFLTQNIEHATEWGNDSVDVFGGECTIIVFDADEIFKDFNVAKKRSETIVFTGNIPSRYIKNIVACRKEVRDEVDE